MKMKVDSKISLKARRILNALIHLSDLTAPGKLYVVATQVLLSMVGGDKDSLMTAFQELGEATVTVEFDDPKTFQAFPVLQQFSGGDDRDEINYKFNLHFERMVTQATSQIGTRVEVCKRNA